MNKKSYIIFILEIILIILVVYFSTNNFDFSGSLKEYLVLGTFIILLLVFCLLKPKEQILKYINKDIEEIDLKEFRRKEYEVKINLKYKLVDEKRGPKDSVIRKYEAANKIMHSEKTLIIIECKELAKEIIDVVNYEIDFFKKNLKKPIVIEPDLDILIFPDNIIIDDMTILNSEILSWAKVRYTNTPNGITIPIVICEKNKKVYISRFDNNKYHSILYYYNHKKKIKKALKKNKII